MKVVILKAFSCKISNLKIRMAKIDVTDVGSEKNNPFHKLIRSVDVMCHVIELNVLKFERWENGSLKFIQEKLHFNFSNLSLWTETLCCMNMTGTGRCWIGLDWKSSIQMKLINFDSKEVLHSKMLDELSEFIYFN